MKEEREVRPRQLIQRLSDRGGGLNGKALIKLKEMIKEHTSCWSEEVWDDFLASFRNEFQHKLGDSGWFTARIDFYLALAEYAEGFRDGMRSVRSAQAALRAMAEREGSYELD